MLSRGGNGRKRKALRARGCALSPVYHKRAPNEHRCVAFLPYYDSGAQTAPTWLPEEAELWRAPTQAENRPRTPARAGRPTPWREPGHGEELGGGQNRASDSIRSWNPRLSGKLHRPRRRIRLRFPCSAHPRAASPGAHAAGIRGPAWGRREHRERMGEGRAPAEQEERKTNRGALAIRERTQCLGSGCRR